MTYSTLSVCVVYVVCGVCVGCGVCSVECDVLGMVCGVWFVAVCAY